MVVPVRTAVLALALAAPLVFAAAGAAAADYVVVASNAPAIARGQTYDAGAVVPLTAGHSLTLMHASGNVLSVRGSAGGVTLPRKAATAAEAERMATLRFIMAPAERPRIARSGLRGATRGGICPLPESLTTLDNIRDAGANGCHDEAALALEAWIRTAPPMQP